MFDGSIFFHNDIGYDDNVKLEKLN